MTLRRWQEHPAARDEYLDAVIWYENQDTGLGARLADHLDYAVDFVRQWPEAAPLYRGRRRLPQTRRKGVDLFPYWIIADYPDDGKPLVKPGGLSFFGASSGLPG